MQHHDICNLISQLDFYIQQKHPQDWYLASLVSELKIKQNNTIKTCKYFATKQRCPYHGVNGKQCWFRHNKKQRCQFDVVGCIDTQCVYTHCMSKTLKTHCVFKAFVDKRNPNTKNR